MRILRPVGGQLSCTGIAELECDTDWLPGRAPPAVVHIWPVAPLMAGASLAGTFKVDVAPVVCRRSAKKSCRPEL
eukprot:12880104-Prorocentrum_lima.AAC.1